MAQPAPFSNPIQPQDILTPEQIAQNRKLGQTLMMQGMSADPVQHWTQGLARVLQGGIGRMHVNAADEAQKGRSTAMTEALQNSGILKGLGPGDTAILGSSPEILDSAYKAALARKMNPTQGMPPSVLEFQYGQQNPQFLEFLRQKKAREAEYGKSGAIFQGEDGQFYSIQFGSDGQRRIEPLTRDGRPLRPARGVKQVGDELVDIGTGAPVRNVAPQIQNQQVAEEVGKDLGKLKASAPRMVAAQEALERDHRIIRDEIDKTREISARSPYATGPAALISSRLPGTTGYQVARLIDTIKARTGFDVLTQMRQASPTGGALGSVTERELAFLQSVLGSLEQVQNQEDLDRILERLAEYTESANDTRRRALEYDLKRAGVAPDILSRQQQLSQFTRNARDTTKTPDGRQREFVGMQPISGVGTPVSPEPAAPPQALPVPLPKERKVFPAPPAQAVDELMRQPSPEMKKFFDDTFGPGAADAVLKGRR